MEEKLRELEERVNFLHSLTLRLVRWTNFQDDKEAGSKDKEDGETNTTLGECRIFKKKERKAVAKKSTSGIRKKHLQFPVDAPSSSILEDNQMKAEIPNSYSLEDSLTEETPFFVKEEPSDDYDDLSWPEEIVNYPSPTAGEEDNPQEFKISGYSPNSFQDDSAGDKDFSPSSNSEDETSSDESSTEDEDFTLAPQSTSTKRNKKIQSSSPATALRKAKPRGMKKVFVQPLSSDVKPPFVSLNRIDGVALKEQYGLSEPKKRTYPCPKCGEVFPLIKLMLFHRKTVHSRFKDKNGLPKEPRYPRNVTYSCETCGESYSKKKLMKAHQKDAHPELEIEKRYKCSICARQFRHRNTQLNHEKTHTGEKPHLCYLCGYTGATSSSLSSHMECKHGVDKDRKCDKCGEKFRTRSQLRWHQIKTHRENRPDFPCKYCGAVFIRSTVLKTHIERLHKGTRPFPCEKCDKSFKTAAELRDHLEKHIVGFKRNRGLQPIKIPAHDLNEDNPTSNNDNQEDPQLKSSTGESQAQTQETNPHNNKPSTASQNEIQKTETEYL